MHRRILSGQPSGSHEARSAHRRPSWCRLPPPGAARFTSASQAARKRGVNLREACWIASSGHVGESTVHEVCEVPSPRISPATVQDLSLEVGVSRHVAFRLQQQFSHLGTEEVKARCFALKEVLKINIEEAGLLASKEPRLLNNLNMVAETFEVLKTALGGVTATEASKVAIYAPSLLTVPAEELKQNYRLITQLGIPEKQLFQLISKQPNILVTKVERLERHLAALLNLLQPLSMDQAVELLCAYPRLMVEDVADLARKVKALQDLLEADSSCVAKMVLSYPQILVTNTEVTAARMESILELLSVERPSVCYLLLKCPNVLRISTNVLRENFEKVFSLFGHEERNTVMRTVADNPALLGLDL